MFEVCSYWIIDGIIVSNQDASALEMIFMSVLISDNNNSDNNGNKREEWGIFIAAVFIREGIKPLFLISVTVLKNKGTSVGNPSGPHALLLSISIWGIVQFIDCYRCI